MNKLISVIIPVYNTEKYVEKALSSVMEQTYKNLEIIVIDDKSTDDSPRIIDEIEEKVDYKAWLCGHWHTDKTVDRIHFLYDTFITDEAFHEKEGSSNETEKY